MNYKKIFIIIFILLCALCAYVYAPHIKNYIQNINIFNVEKPLSTYSNEQYGFEIDYPRSLTPQTTFKRFYHLSDGWRAEISPDSKGEPIISIPVFTVDQGGVATGKPYPLYFDTEVRIGVSSDPSDVKNCLTPDPNYTSQPEADVTINGTTFKRFSFQNAGMMQYIQGESYRTVRNNMCYAIEQVKAGSNYFDDTMERGTPDETLNQYYEVAGLIIQTFRFTR